MAYKYAEILEAMAERAKVSDTPWDVVEVKGTIGRWNDCQEIPRFHSDCQYRLKPRTIKIGSREVSEPLTLSDAEKYGSFFYPSLGHQDKVDTSSVGSSYGRHLVKRGLARCYKDEALELAEALLEVLNG